MVSILLNILCTLLTLWLVSSTCLTPSLPEGGFFLTCGTISGAICQVRCRSNDKIMQKKCSDNGNWIGDEFTCSDTSDSSSCKTDLKVPTNGLIIGECNKSFGSVCNFKCNPDYKLIGPVQVYCIGTIWSSTEPTCVKSSDTNKDSSLVGPSVKCSALYSNPDSYIEGNCYQGAPVGSICYFGCSTGFNLYGSSSAICLPTGKWSSDPPLCIRSSSSTSRPPSGTQQPDDQKTSSSQPKPTTPNNNNDGKKPTSCKPVQNVAKGKLKGNCQTGLIGSSCSVSCSYGYYLTNGSSTITCTNSGQWSGSLGSCNRVKYFLVRTWYW